MSSTVNADLNLLAHRAGLLTRWEDAAGHLQHVSEPVLQSLLKALGLPCMTPSQIQTSLHQLDDDRDVADGGLVVVQAGQVPCLRCHATGRWMLTLESGEVMSGTLQPGRPGWVCIHPVSEPGYHTLSLGNITLTLAVVPALCPGLQEPAVGQPRHWGLVAQIYSLGEASERTGLAEAGDPFTAPAWMQGRNFSAVGKLARYAGHEGACALALSPTHAMFSADPQRYSPYSPSSRLFLNVSYADPVQVLGPGIVEQALKSWSHADIQARVADSLLPDWPRVASLRLRLLRDVFAIFEPHGPAELKERFRFFRQEAGVTLHHHAVYEALHEHHVPALGPGHGWQDWPAPLRDPDSPATADFAAAHEADVLFHAFAQWLAHENLHQAQDSAHSAGMSYGLIRDLAIGTDPRGSHAWGLQGDILTTVSVGAPPDVYQVLGQNWGLTAFSPHGLRRGAYAAFIDTLRANLQCSGGIRIDHIAGMERLWLIPDGATAAQGAYLAYPRRELLGLITLEATRHKALVIGENLGTVSDELNNAMTEHGMLGTSVLWFERDEPGPELAAEPFRQPQHWSKTSVATPSTHDLPTIHGWWQERDIHWKTLLDSFSRHSLDKARDDRDRQRAKLWHALQQSGCASSDMRLPDETPLSAIMSFVASTPCPLALFSMEDLLGVIDQPNMPGTVAGQGPVSHPNWVQPLPQSVDALFADTAVGERLDAVRQARSLP